MKYPIGIQTFEDIRKDGYVYVDKTEQIYRLASTGKFYFLSRPRRFGKSLLVSTMEAYFLGRRDLFDGLALGELEKDWTEHPVLRIDLGGAAYDSIKVLDEKIDLSFSGLEEHYGIARQFTTSTARFEALIKTAHARTGRRVVILIDEYDKPIVDNLANSDLAEVFRRQLQGFYSVMKSQDAHIRLGFLTGVTKLGKLSVFSGLNNLMDLSMDHRFNDICGISESELHQYFGESVQELAASNGVTEEACYGKLALMYDGYRFCEDTTEGIYNPFSLLNTFSIGKFREYWFETGTPSFLATYLLRGNYDLSDLSGFRATRQDLTGANAIYPDAVTLMYQAGYLTIKDYDKEDDRYILGYPNKEVESGFIESLSEFYTPIRQNRSALSSDKFVMDLRRGDTDSFMLRLESFFADMDYSLQGNLELYFQNTMYVLLKLLGQQVQVERHTSNGRIDAVIQTPKYVYILELKRDQSPEAALEQIARKGYDRPFLSSGKEIIRIGINFCSETRRIEGWKAERS